MTPRFFPRTVARGAIAAGALAALIVAGWSGSGANAAVWRLLGIGNVPPASMPRAVTIALSAHAPAFGPPAAAMMSGGQVTFVNGLAVPILVRSTTSAPAPFAIVISAHARATVTLRRPGLYHYYDASTARPSTPPAPASLEYPVPTGYDKPSDVIVPKAGSTLPRQGWIAVLDRAPGLLQQLTIPAGHAVFTPKLLVAVAGSTIFVVNHDEYAHNFVVDSASPTGAAFMIDGTHDTPTHGARRALVLQQPGLYHVYCTLHTQMAGMAGGWHDVTARRRPMDGARATTTTRWKLGSSCCRPRSPRSGAGGNRKRCVSPCAPWCCGPLPCSPSHRVSRVSWLLPPRRVPHNRSRRWSGTVLSPR